MVTEATTIRLAMAQEYWNVRILITMLTLFIKLFVNPRLNNGQLSIQARYIAKN